MLRSTITELVRVVEVTDLVFIFVVGIISVDGNDLRFEIEFFQCLVDDPVASYKRGESGGAHNSLTGVDTDL